jgi:hypothetical protein
MVRTWDYSNLLATLKVFTLPWIALTLGFLVGSLISLENKGDSAGGSGRSARGIANRIWGEIR